MYGYVYLTTNLTDGTKYIGQHQASEFDPNYHGSGVHLLRAISKYGKENFVTEMLYPCENQDELNQCEIETIALHNAVLSEEYYNIAAGGLGHTCDAWNKGLKGPYKGKLTDKQAAALEAGRHLPASEKQRKQLAERRRNCIVSEETRAKLSAANKNQFVSQETRELLSKIMTGRKMPPRSDESKERYRQASSGRIHIHKGTSNKNVLPEEVDAFYADGWTDGYVYKRNLHSEQE